MASLRRELDIETEHVKMREERDKKMAEMVEADRVLVLKRQLLSEFSKVINLESDKGWQEQLVEFLLEKGVKEKVSTDILESIAAATEMLREMEETGKYVPSEIERKNVGEILYWARQG